MMILCEFGNYQPLRRLQTWLIERLVAAQFGSADLRFGLLALAVSLTGSGLTIGCRRLLSLWRSRASRRRNPADTMVAAALR